MERLADLPQSSTLARQIRDVLLDRILSGELAPGTRLKDNEVAAYFGASNTPAREALRLLAQDGLVEIVPYRGCVVRRVDAKELSDLLDIRAALEAFAARIVAAHASAEQLQALEAAVAAHDEACAAGDWQRASDGDTRFHQLLAEATGNRLLARALQRIGNQIRVVGRIHVRQPLLEQRASCRAILEALQARDGERAAALVMEHIAEAKDRVSKALEAGGAKRET